MLLLLLEAGGGKSNAARGGLESGWTRLDEWVGESEGLHVWAFPSLRSLQIRHYNRDSSPSI